MMKKAIMLLLVMLLISSSFSCDLPTPLVQAVDSDVPVNREDISIETLSDANNAFACELYQRLKTNENSNLMYSPFSISSALAMTYAGASGETAEQMADTLYFSSLNSDLNASFKALYEDINQRGKNEQFIDAESDLSPGDVQGFNLAIANALWGQEEYPFLESYIRTVEEYYGGELSSLDFGGNPGKATEIINQWVSDRTSGRIPILFEANLSPVTRLVLTNTVYFKALWQDEFGEKSTEAASFYLLDGTEVEVFMMKQGHAHFGYCAGLTYQAVSLPYLGAEMSMVILLPREGFYRDFENSLSVSKLDSIIKEMSSQEMNLSIPRFKFESEFNLSNTLTDMGMEDAFSSKADFSGMTVSGKLFIDGVIHKTYIAVDEKGTEAAAATGVMMAGAGPPSKTIDLTVDRPFIFLIRDNQTGTILFIGRVLNPLK